jgi:serine/threonine-protein kinase
VTPVELEVAPGEDGRARARLTFSMEGYQRVTVLATGQGPLVPFHQKLVPFHPKSKKKSASRPGTYKDDPY